MERARPSTGFGLMMNDLNLNTFTFKTGQNESSSDGSENTGRSDLSLATAIANQTPSEVLGVELTRYKNTSPEQDFEVSETISDNHTPSGGQNGTHRKHREYREDGRGALPSDEDQSNEATEVMTRTYVDENGNTVTVTIRTTISNASTEGIESSDGDGGSINAEQDPLASPESRTTVTKTYVDENGETVTETLVYRNGELVESSTSSEANEGSEGAPGQQNSDADSNDPITGNALAFETSDLDGVVGITLLVEPTAKGAEDQIELIIDSRALDGASMFETYNASGSEAYSQEYIVASVVEITDSEMNDVAGASDSSDRATDESENLKFVDMMTVETVGL